MPSATSPEAATRAFADRVQKNQQRLALDLQPSYDFIVCGAGPAGSVVARRLAENPAVRVLLLEAGGTDDVPSVTDPLQWWANLGSERDWGFQAEPNPHVNGRALPVSMGKVLGGGSSINALTWARGHRHDWDFFAAEAGDPAWGYDSVRQLYQRVEDWQGAPDPHYRGTGGPVYLQPAPDPNPIAPAMLEGAQSVGIPRFENANGRIQEQASGCAMNELITRDGTRQSVFRAYAFPYMDRPNLTVLTDALVTQILFEGKRATGVAVVYDGQTRRIGADLEIVLSLGAFHTPKLLMQSGIGPGEEVNRWGIPLVQHLPGVGQNLQDHVCFPCIWEYNEPLAPRNNMSEALYYWKSQAALEAPDLQTFIFEAGIPTPENAAQFALADHCWSMAPGLVRPKSRGQVQLTGPNPLDPLRIHLNTLAHPDDLQAARAGVELARAIGNSASLAPYAKREVMPGNLQGTALDTFIRNAAVTLWHQSGTAKMGQDALAVVDGHLKVYGVDNLRIADASIMPVTTGCNTMAPCVIIGERAAELLKTHHRV